MSSESFRQFADEQHLRIRSWLVQPENGGHNENWGGGSAGVPLMLRFIASEFARITGAEHVRSHIMLPTLRGTRAMAGQYGMDGDSDANMELPLNGGCSGVAWVTGKPALADMDKMKKGGGPWHLTPAQRAKNPVHQEAMLSVPIPSPKLGQAGCRDPLGTLSVDSATPHSQWRNLDAAVRFLQQWARTLSLITPSSRTGPDNGKLRPVAVDDGIAVLINAATL